MNPTRPRRSALRLVANVPELNVTHKHNIKDAAQTIALIVGAAATLLIHHQKCPCKFSLPLLPQTFPSPISSAGDSGSNARRDQTRRADGPQRTLPPLSDPGAPRTRRWRIKTGRRRGKVQQRRRLSSAAVSLLHRFRDRLQRRTPVTCTPTLVENKGQ